MNSVFHSQVASYLIGEMPQQVFDDLLEGDCVFNDWVQIYEAIDLVERALELHQNDDHILNRLLANGADLNCSDTCYQLSLVNVRAVNNIGGRELVDAWLQKAKGLIDAN